MNVIGRNYDVINNNEIEKIGSFLDFPCFMGCVDSDISLDKTFDMNFYIGKTTGCIQINPVLPLDVVYQESHGSGTFGQIWNAHHQSFANFIKRYDPKSILEIGGGSGILCKKYNNKNIPWTIVEPNAKQIDNCDAKFIQCFFDNNFITDFEIDTVVHSHVIEHAYYPDDFLRNISTFLSVGKKMIFSVPNLKKMFKLNYNNVVNFEHTVLLTEPYIEHLLSKHNFKILAKEYFLDSHSIFYSVIKDHKVELVNIPKNLYKNNKKMFFNYIDYYDRLIKKLNIQLSKKNSEVYLFGAHVFSQFLINRGLDIGKVNCIIDNDSNKQGKRLYGTNLYVESPKILTGKNNPWIIFKVSNYAEEIKKDIITNINKNTNFLE